MMKKLAFIFVLITGDWCIARQLPASFKKCDVRKNNFNQCLADAIQSAIQQLVKPIDEFGLPSLEPYITPEDTVAEYGNATSGIAQKYLNFKISGLTQINGTKANMDFPAKTLKLDITFNKVRFDFDYQALGRFVLVPIVVSTKGAFIYRKPTFKMTFELGEYENEGQKHFKVVDSRMKMLPQKILFEYDDVLSHKEANAALNNVMNKNWDNILDFWEMMFPRLWIQLFEGMFNNVLEKVPATEMFDGL